MTFYHDDMQDNYKKGYQAGLAASKNRDPDYPPILCKEVDSVNGVRIFRAMGDDVRELDQEWDRQIVEGLVSKYGPYPWDDGIESPHDAALPELVYNVRRKQPKTENVPLASCVGQSENSL